MHEHAVPPVEELLRHARWIEELAHRLVRDPAVADDLAQATWVVALRDPARARSNPRGWLARVVRNLARERHRREAQREPVERRGARTEALPSPHELLERAEAERALVECVTRLDEPHRTTLLLRYFEGLAPEEIARREGVPLATVTHRITRAHERLRERLSEDRGRAGWLGAVAPILERRGLAPVPREEFPFMKIVPAIVAGCLVVAVAVFVFAPGGRKAEPAPIVAAAPDAERTSDPAPPKPDAVRSPAAETTVPAAAAASTTKAPAPPAADAAKSSRLHGRVFRPDGAPAAKRRVRLVDMQPLHGKSSGENYVVCDERGAFDAPGIEAGVWSISTWPDEAELGAIGIAFGGTLNGMAYLEERTIELADGASVELLLGAPPEKPIHVMGQVLQAGEPVDIAAVQWLPVGDGIYDLKKNARTIERRTYETILQKPGRYYATAILDDARPEWLVDVPDQRELELDLVLEPNVVEGRVVDAAGKPVEGASVELSVQGGRRAPMLLASMGFLRSTDAEGRFRFPYLEDANYVVHASGGKLGEGDTPGGAVASAPVRALPSPGARVELVLQPAVRVPVRVVDAAGKERTASVFVFDQRGEPLNPCSGTTGGKAGARTLVPLAPGRYSVVAAAGAAWSAVRELEVRAEGEPAPVKLVLEPAASVSIDARAVPKCFVELVDEGGRRFGGIIDRTRFNRAVERAWDGEIPVLRAPRSNYEVLAIAGDGVRARAKVALRPEDVAKAVLAP